MNSFGSPPAEEGFDSPSKTAAAAAASGLRHLSGTDDSIRSRGRRMRRKRGDASKDGLVSGDERALRNLLEIDDLDLPSSSSSFSFQTDLRPYMRKMVVVWMLEVCEDQSVEDETFWIAVNYFDRILSVLPIRRSQLQLIASACLFIASKFNNNEEEEEDAFIKASHLVTYTDFSITADELLEWELTTLQALKWNVSVATPFHFLRRFVLCLPLADDDDDDDDDDGQRRSVERHATTLIALSATDVKFVVYPASMLASGCLCAAAKELLGIDWVVRVRLYQRLQQYTSVETDCLVTCQEQIEDLVKSSLEEAAAADARQQQQQQQEEEETEETEETEEEDGQSSSLTRNVIKQSSSSKAPVATTPTDVREISVNCGDAGFKSRK